MRILSITICILSLLAPSGQLDCREVGTVYLSEGFEGGTIPPGWTVIRVVGTTATWTVVGTGTNPPIAPHTGIGQAKFNSYDAPAGEQARIITPGIDLTASAAPYVEFFMHHDDEFASNLDSISLEATSGDSISGPWTVIAGVGRYHGIPGWRKEAASLLPFRGMSRVFVCLRGVSNFGNNIFVDDIRIADSSFHDVGVVMLLSSGSTVPGSSVDGARSFTRTKENTRRVEILHSGDAGSTDLFAVVHNFGSFTEPTFQVQWTVDAQPQPPVTTGDPLLPGSADTLLLPWTTPPPGIHTIVSWTYLPEDSNSANDTSRIAIELLDSTIIFFETFNGTFFPPPSWTVVNRDGGTLPAWFRGTVASPFLPFEGSGFAGNNFQRANNLYIDDYLISPPFAGVGGAGQTDTIRFYARSVLQPPPNMNFPDSLMILLSTTGNDTSDFTIPLDYFEVPKTGWSERQYRLTGLVPPNSTVHVAFRYLHYAGGPSGTSSDFIGVDAIQMVRVSTTDVSSTTDLPSDFALLQAYPNPFNPVTNFRFRIADFSAQGACLPDRQGSASGGGLVSLKVYDLLGREVATLVNEMKTGGEYEVTWDAHHQASGVYFARFAATSVEGRSVYVKTTKLILMR